MPKTFTIELPDDVNIEEVQSFYNELTLTSRYYGLLMGKTVVDLSIEAAVRQRDFYTTTESKKVIEHLENLLVTMKDEKREDLEK